MVGVEDGRSVPVLIDQRVALTHCMKLDLKSPCAQDIYTNESRMLSILRKARLKDKEMRILMLGLDNAGKTTIVKRIMGEDVNTVSPTLGFLIKTIDYDG